MHVSCRGFHGAHSLRPHTLYSRLRPSLSRVMTEKTVGGIDGSVRTFAPFFEFLSRSMARALSSALEWGRAVAESVRARVIERTGCQGSPKGSTAIESWKPGCGRTPPWTPSSLRHWRWVFWRKPGCFRREEWRIPTKRWQILSAEAVSQIEGGYWPRRLWNSSNGVFWICVSPSKVCAMESTSSSFETAVLESGEAWRRGRLLARLSFGCRARITRVWRDGVASASTGLMHRVCGHGAVQPFAQSRQEHDNLSPRHYDRLAQSSSYTTPFSLSLSVSVRSPSIVKLTCKLFHGWMAHGTRLMWRRRRGLWP